MTRQRTSRALVLATLLCVLALAPFAHAQTGGAKAKKEHPFTGTVEKVDAKNKTLTVNGDKVEGWMAAMTMIYGVDDPAVVDRIKAGDRIAATVYDGDFQKLYNVKVMPPARK